MSYYAVIDTNVVLAAMLTKNADSATVRVMDAVFRGNIVPLHHEAILAEYNEVLKREKFHLDHHVIDRLILFFMQAGNELQPMRQEDIFPDEDDRIFYEIVSRQRAASDAYLVTGNLRHYPKKDFIVTPARMMDMIDEKQ